MQKTLISILSLILFTLLIAGSVYGIAVPSKKPGISINTVSFYPTQNGITASDALQNQYYSLSPFNDYVLENNTRSTLISIDEIEQNAFNSDFRAFHGTKILHSVSAYFNLYTPAISFQTDKNINYEVLQKNDNTIEIKRSVKFANSIGKKKLGSTITFNAGDLLFDKSGRLYAFANPEHIESMENIYAYSLLEPSAELLTTVEGKTLFIVNPKLSVTLAVSVNENQTILVNRDAKLIEIEEEVTPFQDTYSTSFRISVLKSPLEEIQ